MIWLKMLIGAVMVLVIQLFAQTRFFIWQHLRHFSPPLL